MQVRKTRFCWHCSRQLWGFGGLHFATMFIDGALRMLHKDCKREIEEDPFSFGYDYETGRNDND